MKKKAELSRNSYLLKSLKSMSVYKLMVKTFNGFVYIEFDQTLDILQYKSDYFYSKLSANCTTSAYATSQRVMMIRQWRLDDQLRSKAESSTLTHTGKIKNEYFSVCIMQSWDFFISVFRHSCSNISKYLESFDGFPFIEAHGGDSEKKQSPNLSNPRSWWMKPWYKICSSYNLYYYIPQ